ncbi:glycoside hydrolase family 53 protein [Aliagarivorans taiwanensis]|uniref:glycoside hydrolase family 53 protein n=1 Tax=Aliagarivorans taiwanensis TaxID=561966 RepID=UPI0003FF4760|nr:glycosyl hydrolase 53 family protein [Aliagarivorans taiwanensis]
MPYLSKIAALLLMLSFGGSASSSMRFGADLSYINQVENYGGRYYHNGEPRDPYALFAEHGTEMIRLRLWHSPEWHDQLEGANGKRYSDLADVMHSAARAKQQGMQVLLNFHYSDSWADPQHQDIPKAWQAIRELAELEQQVYQYTYDTLERMASKQLLPEAVQIGNETNCGMLYTNSPTHFPKLSVCDGHWLNAGHIFNAAIRAVRDIDQKYRQDTIVLLHVADPAHLAWWFEGITKKAKVDDFDAIGFSYYPLWHSSIGFDALPEALQAINQRFERPLWLLETAYPHTRQANDSYPNLHGDAPLLAFPASPEGQLAFLQTLRRNLAQSGTEAMFYWEPGWISSNMRDLWGQGSSWENCAFFDYQGELLPAITYQQE